MEDFNPVKYFVVGVRSKTQGWALNLEPKLHLECLRSISRQKIGTANATDEWQTDWRICVRLTPTFFRCVLTAQLFEFDDPHPYTPEAYEAFLASWREPHGHS